MAKHILYRVTDKEITALLQHMIIGGLPLLVISVLNHDPAMSGNLKELTSDDIWALLYTSIFGSAISYGVFFYNATRGRTLLINTMIFIFFRWFDFLLLLFPYFFS